jgi:prepilin-type N-terminal cleavage/methylation domain-containing protein
MKVKNKKNGFTLTELMVGMLATAILLLVVGTALVMATRGWRDYTRGVNLQRDAQLAMRVIAREIRNSNVSEISADASGIDFIMNGTRTNTFAFNAVDIPQNDGVQLVDWTQPVIGSNFVEIAFSLRTTGGTYQKSYVSTIYPRN